MSATSHTEQPIFICSVSASSDVALKQFIATSKNIFSPTQFICPMKTAIDLAIKGKPPVIKPIQGDILNMPGNLLSLVISNWLNAQLRKPPPKAPQKRPTPARKNSRAINVIDMAAIEALSKAPYIVFILDYPRSVEQFQTVIKTHHAPIYCHISIEGGSPPPDKKNAVTNLPQNISHELKKVLSSDLVFFKLNVNSEMPFEQQIKDLIPNIYSVFNGSNEYKSFYSDTCYVTLPSYPTQPVALPLIMPEKPTKSRAPDSSRGSIGNASSSTQLQLVDIKNDSLNLAFKTLFLSEIETFMKSSSLPYFSTNFQHYAEKYPKFPLPASLAQVLAIRPNFKANEIFLMRNAACRCNIPYDVILRVLMKKKFEEIIGYKISDRNVKEFLALEILPNVIAPLSEEFSEFKAVEFAGKLLLAFYHKMPKNLPINEFDDVYHIPTYCGFGKYYKKHGPFSKEPIEVLHPKDVGVNAGSEDIFLDMNSDDTRSTTTDYFCESGLRVVTYQAQVSNGVLEKLHFNLSFCQNERFSFCLSQKPSAASDDDEEEDSVETVTFIRGVLGKNTEMYFEHSNDKVNIVISRKNIKIEFDVISHIVIISGLEGETHRVITPKGKLIRYTPQPVIYHPDGCISRFFRETWEMVDSKGKGYVKRGKDWFRQPQLDATSNTISTHFTSRKVTNRSNGLSIIEDNNDTTLLFPDGTKYNKNTNTFSNKKLPLVTVNNGSITVDSKEFVVVFNENKDCNIALKNQDCSINFNEELRHLLIQFGQSGNIMTMVDLLTGSVANVGARRFVYYLSEEWNWILGRQLCSKKEILQHFQEGDFIERIQTVDKVEKEEIEAIINNGHTPRLFVVEKDFNDFNVFELLDDNTFKNISEKAINYSPKSSEKFQTLWFDAKPRSFREIKVFPKISTDTIEKVEKAMDNEYLIQNNNKMARESTVDPKWRDIEQKQDEDEEQMKKLFEKYGINFNV